MTDMKKKLDDVYQAGGDRAKLDGVYDNWAATYDRDLWATGNPYIAMIVGLCGRYIADRHARILDGGCGTGNLGEVLFRIGYDNLIGLEPSDGMRRAAAGKGCYREIHGLLLDTKIDLPAESFDAVTAAGVLTAGHAGSDALDGILSVAKPGAPIIFSISIPAVEDFGFGGKMQSLSRDGDWSLVEQTEPFRTYPFLDEYADLRHWICVYRKAER